MCVKDLTVRTVTGLLLFLLFLEVMEDGSICDTFTHKSLLPHDMDPLSLRGTLSSDGVLVVSVQRLPCAGVGGARLPEPPDARPVPHSFAFDP